ncbi:MAG: L,D-transpeptidase [Bdellovibrionota bacterium]
MEVVVYKSKKEMEIWEAGRCTHRFPIGIGKDEVGQKEIEGDMRTPEGEYVVCVKNPKSKFFLSVGLNYPNNSDAERGLAHGNLTQQEFEAICKANDEGKVPPWKTKMGGEIFIHGELEKKDWSEGCVRLFNKDMQWLFERAQLGTRVTIKP